jgi:transcriptional regulator with XRE-family HTH domain
MKKISQVSEKDCKNVGMRLKEVREYLNMFQEEMANTLGVSPTMYQNYENGRNLLSSAALLKLTEIDPTKLNHSSAKINTHWLLTGVGALQIVNRPEGCFDSKLLSELIENLENVLLKNDWSLTPYSKGSIIARLFAKFSKTGEIDLEELNWMAEHMKV